MAIYFDNSEEGFAYGIKYYKEYLIENNEESIRLWKAIIEHGTDHFYCSHFDGFGSKYEGECGRMCEGYAPRNGKNGRCRYSKNCYVWGDEYLLKKTGGKFTLTKIDN